MLFISSGLKAHIHGNKIILTSLRTLVLYLGTTLQITDNRLQRQATWPCICEVCLQRYRTTSFGSKTTRETIRENWKHAIHLIHTWCMKARTSTQAVFGFGFANSTSHSVATSNSSTRSDCAESSKYLNLCENHLRGSSAVTSRHRIATIHSRRSEFS